MNYARLHLAVTLLLLLPMTYMIGQVSYTWSNQTTSLFEFNMFFGTQGTTFSDYGTVIEYGDGDFDVNFQSNPEHGYIEMGSFNSRIHYVESYRPGALQSIVANNPVVVGTSNISTPTALPVNMQNSNVSVGRAWSNARQSDNIYFVSIENSHYPIGGDFGHVDITTPAPLVITAAYSYVGNSIVYHTISANSVTWSYSNLAYGEQQHLFLNTTLDAALIPSGMTQVMMRAEINSGTTPDNNINMDISAIAQYPHDPNLVVVSHECIHHLSKSQGLSYTVQFQNTGDTSATDVEVYVDLPDPQLVHYNSIKMDSSSHLHSWKIVNNQLQVFYSGIHLPGTKQIPTNSKITPNQTQGWFTFSLCTKPSLSKGSFLNSKAAIIFDKEDPVHTNTAITKVDDCLHAGNFICEEYNHNGNGGGLIVIDPKNEWAYAQIDVYPNPVNDALFFNVNEHWGTGAIEVSVRNIEGELLKFVEGYDIQQIEVNVSDLPNGLYVYKIINSEFVQSGQIIKE